MTTDYLLNQNRFLMLKETSKEGGKELFLRKSRGYVSYVQGENPFTFPNAIYPKDDPALQNNSLIHKLNNGWSYPNMKLNGTQLDEEEKINFLDLFLNDISPVQKKAYDGVIQEYFDKETTKIESNINIQSINTILQLLNITYPSIDGKSQYGSEGLNNYMKHDNLKNFEYNDEYQEYGRIFDMDKVYNYSRKIHKILESVIS